jgi:glutamate racemase
LNFSYETKKLDLAVNWKISRNESLFKENFFFQITNDKRVFEGEIAPNIRYGEAKEKVIEQLELLCQSKELDELLNLLSRDIFFHSVHCGVEQAVLSLRAFEQSQNLSDYLKCTISNCETSFSIPIMEENDLEGYLAKHSQYNSYKIKVNRDNALSFVLKIASLTAKSLRIDANESFLSADDFLLFYNKIKHLNIEFIEQPLPSTLFDEYIILKPNMLHPLVADESIEDVGNFEELQKGFDVINIKLMKTGGILNAQKLIREAKRVGLDIMIGCMIETSLGISYAMNLVSEAKFVDLDGALLLKEDPYKNLINYNKSILSLS